MMHIILKNMLCYVNNLNIIYYCYSIYISTQFSLLLEESRGFRFSNKFRIFK